MKYKMIEQKGMTFDHYFSIHSPFLLPSILGRKRKWVNNNQSRGQKSCLSARSYKMYSFWAGCYSPFKLRESVCLSRPSLA